MGASTIPLLLTRNFEIQQLKIHSNKIANLRCDITHHSVNYIIYYGVTTWSYVQSIDHRLSYQLHSLNVITLSRSSADLIQTACVVLRVMRSSACNTVSSRSLRDWPSLISLSHEAAAEIAKRRLDMPP